MKINVHLTYSGQCEVAFRFYQRCLGGVIDTMLKYRDSPMADQVPAAWQEKIMHANLSFDGCSLVGADLVGHEFPRGFFVLLDVDEPSNAERIFRLLSEDGRIQMPIQETFWAARFGVLVDRFGVPWEVNCGQSREGSIKGRNPE